MITINKLFQQFSSEYIERFGDLMPKNHFKVIEAIVNCRTDTYGMSFYQCATNATKPICFTAPAAIGTARSARAIKPGSGSIAGLIASFRGITS